MKAYQNGRPAMLLETEDEEPYIVASTNGTSIGSYIFIKDDSENQDILNTLIEYQAVYPDFNFVTGFAEVTTCKLCEELYQEYKRYMSLQKGSK